MSGPSASSLLTFASAAPAELLLASEKDDTYVAVLAEQAATAAQALCGGPAAQAWAGELRTAVALLYYALTTCLLYTSPSPRDGLLSRMPSSA